MREQPDYAGTPDVREEELAPRGILMRGCLSVMEQPPLKVRSLLEHLTPP